MRFGTPNLHRTLHHWPIVILLACFLVSGIMTLSHYGMTWDEGLGNFFFGERYLFYHAHLDPQYLDFKSVPPALKNTQLPLFESQLHTLWWEFPPVADICSAATMHLFSYRLGWMNPVSGFHLFTILLCALTLGFFYFFFAPRIGTYAAFTAVLMMAAFPRLWTDMHFNVKDVPQMALYGLAIIAYYSWVEKPRVVQAILAGILSGLALGVKVNAVFIPITIILGIWPLCNPRAWKSFFVKQARKCHHYFLMIVSALTVYFLSWPILQRSPKKVYKYFEYVLSQDGRDGGPGWKWQPAKLVFYTMPEIMLFFLAAGILLILFYGVIKLGWFNKEEEHLLVGESKTPVVLLRLLLVWFLLPIVRISLPGMTNFDGIRHYLEFVPAAALIAAWFGSELVLRFGRKKEYLRKAGIVVFCFVVALNGTIGIAKLFPYSHVYFNSFAGGLNGAEKIFGKDEVADYWGFSYRKGIEWLNNNAPRESIIYVPVAGWVVQLVRHVWLRPDLSVITEENEIKAAMQGAVRPIYIMFVTRPSCYTDLTGKTLREKIPVYKIEKAGETMLNVFCLYP